ncbi:unnamed protein product, partial [Sphacelaria rigidula]
ARRGWRGGKRARACAGAGRNGCPPSEGQCRRHRRCLNFATRRGAVVRHLTPFVCSRIYFPPRFFVLILSRCWLRLFASPLVYSCFLLYWFHVFPYLCCVDSKATERRWLGSSGVGRCATKKSHRKMKIHLLFVREIREAFVTSVLSHGSSWPGFYSPFFNSKFGLRQFLLCSISFHPFVASTTIFLITSTSM